MPRGAERKSTRPHQQAAGVVVAQDVARDEADGQPRAAEWLVGLVGCDTQAQGRRDATLVRASAAMQSSAAVLRHDPTRHSRLEQLLCAEARPAAATVAMVCVAGAAVRTRWRGQIPAALHVMAR